MNKQEIIQDFLLECAKQGVFLSVGYLKPQRLPTPEIQVLINEYINEPQ